MNISSEQDLKKAVDALNKVGKSATLTFTNDISLEETHNINFPLSIDGGFKNIEFKGGTLNYTGKVKGLTACQTTKLGEIVKTDAQLTEGSYIICQSNDKLAVDPHSPNGVQHPQEIHLVNYVKPKMVGVESFVVDPMDGVLSVLNPLENIYIKNLTASFSGKQPDYSTALKFDGVANVVLENLHFRRGGPGAIWFNNAYNCRIDGCRIDGTVADDVVYGIVVGTVNNFFINDCIITGCRHAFTTTAGTAKGSERWGTPLNVIMNNCIINVPTKNNGVTRVGLDTHPEGYGIQFKNSTINVGTASCNYAGFARARNTRFYGCVFNGGGIAKGIEIYSGNCSIDNCRFNNFWIGVSTKKLRGVYSNDLSITNCFFEDILGPPIFLEYGSGHTVKNCAFKNFMFNPSSTYKKYKGPIVGTYLEP